MGNHVQQPWRFPDDIRDASGLARHPLAGLPLDVLDVLGRDLAQSDAFYHWSSDFYSWDGPLAEASAGGWTLTGSTGAATIAASTDANGVIVPTMDNTASGSFTLTHAPAGTGWSPLRYTRGKRMWAFAKLQFQTVASMEFFFGFGTPDLAPTTTNTFPADGIFFEKAAAATDLDFHVRKDGTSTEKTSALATTLADATYATVGFVVDKDGHAIPYLGTTAKTSKMVAAGDANFPTAAGDALVFMFAFLGQALTMKLDWLTYGVER